MLSSLHGLALLVALIGQFAVCEIMHSIDRGQLNGTEDVIFFVNSFCALKSLD